MKIECTYILVIFKLYETYIRHFIVFVYPAYVAYTGLRILRTTNLCSVNKSVFPKSSATNGTAASTYCLVIYLLNPTSD